MRILVTGGAGFIGSHVVDAYIEAGHRVVVVDDLSSGSRANLNPAVTFYELDIRQPELREIFAAEQPDVVNHHAAQIDVRRSVSEPAFDADVNVLGSINLLECACAVGLPKVIYISSGGAIYGEPERLPCDEAHPVHPLSPYGVSKYAVEQYLHTYRESYGLDYTVLRYANVYGPRQDPHGEAGVVAIFSDQMLADERPTIYGSGEQARDFVYVADCARANLLALNQGSGRAYNLGTGRATSINALAALLKETTGYQGSVAHGPAKSGEVFCITLDAGRAWEELGWRPEVTLNEGLQRTVAYFRRLGDAG
ncbi:MAG: NAD-dependent epimerase/dehydratase family protein [Anaerolineae bacterium]